MSEAIGKDESAETTMLAASAAKVDLASSSAESRNAFLDAFATGLDDARDRVMEANAKDVADARAAGLSEPMVDRLDLSGAAFPAMSASVRAVAKLEDPIGSMEEPRKTPSGIGVRMMRVPLGLVCFIYESRPGVTAEGASLCIKSGNAAILRGGSEAMRSSLSIAEVGRKALADAGLPMGALGMLPTSSREQLDLLLSDARLDLVIPRGGAGLVGHVQEVSKAPVLAHLLGNCHLYVHEGANLEMASRLVVNSKCDRPSTCNALESLLVDVKVAEAFVPAFAKAITDLGVELVGCERAVALAQDLFSAASDDDWDAEYLALKLSVKVIDGLDEAAAWINRHGTAHTDGIVTEVPSAADRFIRLVDSSSVMVNTSTRFADGFEYGLGAETGISTGKLHARGPVGLEGLTSRKWVVTSSGMTRG